MSALKKATDLEFQWSKKSEEVDRQWEIKMNTTKKPARLEDYINFLESVRPIPGKDDKTPRCTAPFTL